MKKTIHKQLILAALFLFLLLWQWNGLVYDLWTGFDAGVQNMELFVSYDDSLHYGQDLVGTPYLPLSWLFKGIVPALLENHGIAVLQSICINVFSAGLRVLVIALFWEKARSIYAKVIAGLATVLVFVGFPVAYGISQVDLCILAISLLICKLHTILKENAERKGGEEAENRKPRFVGGVFKKRSTSCHCYCFAALCPANGEVQLLCDGFGADHNYGRTAFLLEAVYRVWDLDRYICPLDGVDMGMQR